MCGTSGSSTSSSCSSSTPLGPTTTTYLGLDLFAHVLTGEVPVPALPQATINGFSCRSKSQLLSEDLCRITSESHSSPFRLSSPSSVVQLDHPPTSFLGPKRCFGHVMRIQHQAHQNKSKPLNQKTSKALRLRSTALRSECLRVAGSAVLEAPARGEDALLTAPRSPKIWCSSHGLQLAETSCRSLASSFRSRRVVACTVLARPFHKLAGEGGPSLVRLFSFMTCGCLNLRRFQALLPFAEAMERPLAKAMIVAEDGPHGSFSFHLRRRLRPRALESQVSSTQQLEQDTP